MNTPKIYAGSENYLKNLAKDLLEAPLHNESSLVIWFPAIGRSVYLQEFFGLNKGISDFMPSEQSESKFVFIQCAMVISQNRVLGFFRLLAAKLRMQLPLKKPLNLTEGSEESILSEIEQICQVCVQEGKTITFVIDELEIFTNEEVQRIVNGLASLVLINRNAIHTSIHLQNLDLVPLFQRSEKVLSLVQKIIYLSPPTLQESEIFSQTFINRWKIKITFAQKEVLKILAGNNMLVKAYVRSMREGKNFSLHLFLKSYEITAKTKLFLNLIGKDERRVLEQALFNQPISENLIHVKQYLEEIGVLKRNGKRYSVYPAILAELIRRENTDNVLQLNNAGELMLGPCNLTSVLSQHEYQILKLLFKHANNTVLREQIAEVIWGEYFQKLYSDWAIDKTMSRLRKQLLSIGFSESQLQTVKGKGFLLQNI